MKNWLLALILCCCSGKLARATPVETFASANEAYDQSDFGTAIERYEALLRRGETRPEIYYNLGLAYEKSVNPGRAILSFERALLLDPGLSGAQTHLQALSASPNRWWEKIPRFGMPASLIAGAAGLWLLLLSLAAHSRALGGIRHLWTISGALGLIILGTASASFFLRDYPLASPNRAIVLKTEKLRANFTASSPTILSLQPGAAVEIISVNGPWTGCRLPDKTWGWLATSSLERVIPQS